MLRSLAVAALTGLLSFTSAEAADIPKEDELLPRGQLFDPLTADPRWPHFSAAVHSYGGDAGLNTAGAVSLGDGFLFYRGPVGEGGWSIGLQASVFAVFDLDAASKDLVNADYWVGIPVAWREGEWSALGRIYHQSSHLGDEFLLRSQNNEKSRINLSFEAVDVKLSRDFLDKAIRVYAGGGILFDQEPDLKRGMLQGGLELRSPWAFANEHIRPIAALDLQSIQETGWNMDVSTRAGIEINGDKNKDLTVKLLLEYYHGRNPNGQFYVNDVEFYGFGAHVFF